MKEKDKLQPTDIRLHAIVEGTVQGVGFRYFALRVARSYGLTGYVKNTREGDVEVVAEGAREELERLARDLKSGPRRGLVREVLLEWSESTDEFMGFDVRF